jgi:hypothetical protein
MSVFEILDPDKVLEKAKRIGWQISKNYPGVEAEDITGEILEHLVSVAGRLTSTEDDYLDRVMRRAGASYAAKERYEYIVRTSQYVYTPREVRALLRDAYYIPEMWKVPTAKDEHLSAAVSGDTVIVSLLDVEIALTKVTARQREVIHRAFYFRNELSDAERKQLQRAIDAVTKQLNLHINRDDDSDVPGSRKVITNANARYVTENQW